MPSAADLVKSLGLQPHPEGGHYRETYRASGKLTTTRLGTDVAGGERLHDRGAAVVEPRETPEYVSITENPFTLSLPPCPTTFISTTRPKATVCPTIRSRPSLHRV